MNGPRFHSGALLGYTFALLMLFGCKFPGSSNPSDQEVPTSGSEAAPTSSAGSNQAQDSSGLGNSSPSEVVADLPPNPGTIIAAGTLSTSRWTASGSPYRISGDITLPEGSTLTVDAGVTVIFEGAYKFSVLGGELLLQGAQDKPIRFTAKITNPGWYGILFCPDVNCSSSSNKGILEAQYTIFEYARANDKDGDFRYWRRGGALLLLHTASVKISDSIFRYNFASEVGGALELIAIDNSQTAQLDRILFLGNEAGSGGALRLSHINNRTWTGLVFESNQVRGWPDSYGGAIEAEDIGGITLSNTIAKGNQAEVIGKTSGLGGAFYCYAPSLVLAPPYEITGNTPEDSTGCGQEGELKNLQGKKGQVQRTVPNYQLKSRL